MIKRDKAITKVLTYSNSIERLYNQRKLISNILSEDGKKVYNSLYRILIKEQIDLLENTLRELQE